MSENEFAYKEIASPARRQRYFFKFPNSLVPAQAVLYRRKIRWLIALGTAILCFCLTTLVLSYRSDAKFSDEVQAILPVGVYLDPSGAQGLLESIGHHDIVFKEFHIPTVFPLPEAPRSWEEDLGLPALFGSKISNELRRISNERSPIEATNRSEWIDVVDGIRIPSIFSVLQAEWQRTEFLPQNAFAQDMKEHSTTTPVLTEWQHLLRSIGNARKDCQYEWLRLREDFMNSPGVLASRTKRLVQECWQSEWDLLSAKSSILRKEQSIDLVDDTLAWYPEGVWSMSQYNLRAAFDRVYRTAYGCGSDVSVSFSSKRERWPLPSDLLPFLRDNRTENLAEDVELALTEIQDFWAPEILPPSMIPGGANTVDKLLPVVPEGIPKKLAVLMLAVNGMNHPDLWDAWIEDANKWAHGLFLARQPPYDSLPDGAAFEPLLKLVLHASGVDPNNENQLKAFPLGMRKALVPSVNCLWGNLNFCDGQLIRFALADPTVAWMSLVSDSSIPLKPFKQLYHSWQTNPRSQFDFLPPSMPMDRKHSQWISLTRSHALTLMKRPDKWLCSRWLWFRRSDLRFWYMGAWAAPDEYLPFHALYETIGSPLLAQINQGESTSLLVPRREIGRTIEQFRGVTKHWLCWTSWESVNCKDYGKGGKLKQNSPFTYTNLYSEKLEELVRNPEVWFMRKVAPGATVIDRRKREEILLKDYLFAQFDRMFSS